MRISDLTKYAEEKYQIKENFSLTNSPNHSVLVHPQSQRWIALLIREYDKGGILIEKCDLRKRNSNSINFFDYWEHPSYVLKGSEWLGFDLNATDTQELFNRFDDVIEAENEKIKSIVECILASKTTMEDNIYEGTNDDKTNWKTIREMQQLFSYDYIFILDIFTKFDNSDYKLDYDNYSIYQLFESKNFYVQGKYMENYTDELSSKKCKSLKKNYPTYHDMDAMQLRHYFSWRTKIRNGIFEKISAPYARVYIFELLNSIGTHSIDDALNQLIVFNNNYVNTNLGSLGLQANMTHWIFGFIIVNNLSRTIALQYEPTQSAIDCLLNSNIQNDNAIILALNYLMQKELSSVVIKKNCQVGIHYFAEIWRICFDKLREIIFGNIETTYFDPFPDVPYWPQEKQVSRLYELTESCHYYFNDGLWKQKSYHLNYGKQDKLKYFIHAVDLKLRLYFNTGSFLKEKKSDYEFFPFIDESIEIIKENLKPKIAINITSLDKIRHDSDETRDNLLTEEDMTDDIIKQSENKDDSELEMFVLKLLLNGENANDFIKNEQLLPSVIADKINEMFIDEIGDSIVECDGSTLSIIEDYREDIVNILSRK